MSKERARKRAQERARKRAPKTRSDHAGPSAATAARRPAKKTRKRTAREQRHRRRIWIVAGLWLAANAVIWVLTETWQARWVGLTITTILVPLIVWLVWDPERRVDL